MAQKIFINWKDGLNSFDVSQMFLGILTPGRYCGYDIMTPSTLNFTLSHNITGIVQSDINVNPTNPTGVLVTKQGMIVQESATITSLVAVTNAGNAAARLDLVILDHTKVNTPGGAAATYIVVKGFLAGANQGLDPALPLPNQQIIVGRLLIPSGAATLAAATWTPAPSALLGGQDLFTNYPILKTTFGQLATENSWGGRQNWTISPTTIAVTTSGSNNLWTVPTNGNIFRSIVNQTISEINVPSGTPFQIICYTNNLTIDLNRTPGLTGFKLRCPALEKLGLSATITTIQMNPGETITLMRYSGTVYITACGDLLSRYAKLCKAYYTKAGTPTVSSYGGSSASVITFSSITSDDDSLLSNSGGRFTAPADGKYQLNTFLHWALAGTINSGANSIGIQIWKNGVLAFYIGGDSVFLNANATGVGGYLSALGNIDLVATDYIELYYAPNWSPSNNLTIFSDSTCEIRMISSS